MGIFRSVLKSNSPIQYSYPQLPDLVDKQRYQQLSVRVYAARNPYAEAGQVVHGRILAGRDQPAGIGPLSLAGPELGFISQRNQSPMSSMNAHVKLN